MISKLKEEWLADANLNRWNSRSCVQDTKCGCSEPNLIELWEQDSCVRGRIDTIVCTNCDKVSSFSIIR
jgi:hypothetical protein